jgi:hypothetical protein
MKPGDEIVELSRDRNGVDYLVWNRGFRYEVRVKDHGQKGFKAVFENYRGTYHVNPVNAIKAFYVFIDSKNAEFEDALMNRPY